MDWLRRNWPDLIIGVALVAVIAGIVATLLSGGSLSLSGQGLGDTSTGRSAAVEGSQNPGQNTGQDTEQSAEGGAGESAAQNPESQANAPANSADSNASGDAAQQSGIEPVAPDLPSNASDNAQAQADETPAQNQDEAAGAASGQNAENAAAGGSAEDNAAAPPSEGETAETPPDASETTVPVESPSYRVSVGAFASREGAQNLTERYSEEGFPTFVASQGDLSLALVGPYATEEEANSVAQTIIEGGGEALVYSYEPEEASSDEADAEGSAAAEEGAEGAAEGAEDTAVASTPTTGSAVNSGEMVQSGTFLQAGAFGSSDSARFRRERIEELGYRTSERETGAGLVRLFVGPLGPNELEEVQAQLQALGIDSFPVSIP